MAKACVRNHDFFIAMAEELGEWWVRTIADAELASESDWRRIDRYHMEDAATELATAVRGLPQPIREVVQRRSSGQSWKTISRELPDRVYWSITEDWGTGLRLVWTRYGDLVRRLV